MDNEKGYANLKKIYSLIEIQIWERYLQNENGSFHMRPARIWGSLGVVLPLK